MERESAGLCDQPCISTIYNENGEEEVCANYNKAMCFEPMESDIDFYRAINWPELSRNITDFMTSFSNSLNEKYTTNENGFQTLFNKVYSFMPRPGEELFKQLNLVKGENFTKCGDINFAFTIDCRLPGKAEYGGKNFRIFHIALHPEKSKYTSIASDHPVTRSMWSCGYYPKKTEGAVGSGPFHYKIDNFENNVKKISNNSCGSRLDETKCPYKSFNHIGNLFEKNNDDFQNMGEVRVDLHEDVMGLHNMIYNWFIDSWNEYIKSVSGGYKKTRRNKKTKYQKLYKRKSKRNKKVTRTL